MNETAYLRTLSPSKLARARTQEAKRLSRRDLERVSKASSYGRLLQRAGIPTEPHIHILITLALSFVVGLAGLFLGMLPAIGLFVVMVYYGIVLIPYSAAAERGQQLALELPAFFTGIAAKLQRGGGLKEAVVTAKQALLPGMLSREIQVAVDALYLNYEIEEALLFLRARLPGPFVRLLVLAARCEVNGVGASAAQFEALGDTVWNYQREMSFVTRRLRLLRRMFLVLLTLGLGALLIISQSGLQLQNHGHFMQECGFLLLLGGVVLMARTVTLRLWEIWDGE